MPMRRRALLQLGLGATAVMAVAGGGMVLWRPGLQDGRLSAPAREVVRAVARAVLDGSLPHAPAEQHAALQAHLGRFDDTVASFPASTQAELSQLMALLASTPGRRVLAGLSTPWPDAPTAEVQAALQGMRMSGVALRQQAYQALRDLTNAAYFSDPSAWASMHYPGPPAL